jgi:CubicO group peptidase (beta-lactamase class C family)
MKIAPDLLNPIVVARRMDPVRQEHGVAIACRVEPQRRAGEPGVAERGRPEEPAAAPTAGTRLPAERAPVLRPPPREQRHRAVRHEPRVADAAIRPAGAGGDTTRGLGFQLLGDGSWGGTAVPPGTFGHTGFTGTSLWCCPRHDLCVVLLTNRVHPTRVNGRIDAVRRAVHDAVLHAVR